MFLGCLYDLLASYWLLLILQWIWYQSTIDLCLFIWKQESDITWITSSTDFTLNSVVKSITVTIYN